MKRYLLPLAALVTLTAGTVTAANAVEFGVGPNGVYVGPGYHRYYRDYDYDRDRDAYNAYGGCRTIITHRTNRFGEDVVVRRRVCD